jgi:hypothetical protein
MTDSPRIPSEFPYIQYEKKFSFLFNGAVVSLHKPATLENKTYKDDLVYRPLGFSLNVKQKMLTNVQSTEQCLASSKILTPTPSPPSECVLPRTKGGGYTLAGVRGWGVHILEDARHWIGL